MAGVTRQRLSEQVAGHLRELIVEGEIEAGHALPPERELARRFGVSSVVIREALTSLSATGLVTVRHGVGSFVTTPDHWHMAGPVAMLIRSGRADLLHIVESRAIIEVEMCGLAAERRDDDALHALDAALEHMAGTLDKRVANVEADMDFHRAIATGAGNPVLWLLLQPILAPVLTGMLRGTDLPAAMARPRRAPPHSGRHWPARRRRGARRDASTHGDEPPRDHGAPSPGAGGLLAPAPWK